MAGIDLQAHIAALRAKEAAAPKVVTDNILFWGTSLDKDFLPHLKGCVGSVTTHVRIDKIETITQVTMQCDLKKVTKVFSTSVELLKKVLHWDKRAAPSLDNYAGSYFKLPPFKKDGQEIELVFIKPLKHLVTVPFNKFMTTRMISKLTKPDSWYKPTAFNGFTLITPAIEASIFAKLSAKECFLIAVDIETLKVDANIRCLSYTAFFTNENGGTYSDSVELALDSEYALAIMRKWNWELKAPKVLQNGKYDIAYFARFSAPLYNYLYDTANLFHCWYSELPKDLGFLNSFFVREAVYWKDLSETNDLQEYYKYNALDTWGTGNAFLAMMAEVPEYALNNYLLEFPLVFPCHLSEMTGIARDMDTMEAARSEQQAIIDRSVAELNTILAVPAGETFNVASPIQVKQMLKVLGCADLPSGDEKNLKKARFRHPFNARIISLVITIRKARKLVSTYITAGKEFTRQDGTGHRVLYSLNPQGTDSSRLASREHAFWCGINMQNVPRGAIVKSTLKADDGFALCEVDLEQAESRDTAYISGDETLINNVEFSPDFHCANASAFFGFKFEDLFDEATGKVLNKPIRNLAKPVNHGANYNMGAYVLIETMGEENILLAKQLLKLPKMWGYVKVAEHLLESFHKTYPDIKKVFYAGVVEEILKTHKLSSMAVHHAWTATKELGTLKDTFEAKYAEQVGKAWVRYCFSDPSKSKQSLNSYISHPPQALNAQTLNRAYLNVFNDIANSPEHKKNFKLLAQIHDSIFFQYRIGHEYLCNMVKERMEIPVTIKAYDGIVRTFVVPAGAKKGDHLEGAKKGRALYWSETE